MDDDLESFIAEQKAKVAAERAILAQDPPYLEIKTKDYNGYNSAIKENIPPSKWSSVQRLHSNQEESGLSLPLGEDYERKKHRLQQELRLDYRRYMAQGRQVNVGAGEAGRSQHGLYLALKDRRQAQALSKAPSNSLEIQPRPRSPTIREQLPPRKDAATLTEAGPAVPRGRRYHEGRSHRTEGELDQWERPRDVRAELGSGRDCSDYEEEEELAVQDRRAPRGSLEVGHGDRRGRRYGTDRDVLRFRERGLSDFEDFPEMFRYLQRLRNENRLLRERRGAEPPEVRDDDYREGSWGALSTTPKPRLLEAGLGRPNEKSRATVRENEVEFATGLMIGAADADVVAQRRKEQYRLQLQEQMAEQQRNRKREKELELKVAVTGALDPEKPPDRIRHFGPMGRNSSQLGRGFDAPGVVDMGRVSHDERLPPERPRVAFQSPLLDYGAALGVLDGSVTSGVTPVHEDYLRGPSSNLGDISATRLSGAPHPPPSTLSDMYRTPYDEAYFFYGARDPLDPGLAHLAPPTALNLPSAAPSLTPSVRLGPHPLYSSQTDAGPLRPRISVFPPGKDERQAKESLRSYQEALKQQIREQQERRRREKEESKRYDARLEVELKTYDPWGRGGGGAPLRDDQGNLISDLNQMHKTNEEAYLNPPGRDKKESGSGDRKEPPPNTEERPPSSARVSGFSFGQTSPFARGNVFTDAPTPQQLQQQDKYKDYLKQQIEEKRRREAEERERLRQEEEKEERKLAEQRARIQQEYEEEQEKRRRKEMEQKAKNEELVRLAEERRKEAERKKKEQEEKEREARRREYEQERQARQQEVVRVPSPPIPTLQKRWSSQYTPRPPSVDSRHSAVSLSERCLSGSQSPPVPARRNQLRAAAEQQGVISELSALRRQLRSEQRRLGEQMQAERDGLDTPLSERYRDKERPQVDVFDMARLRIQAPVRRPTSKSSEPISVRSSFDFRLLGFRDRDSVEDAGQPSYPEPPGEGGGAMQQRRAASLRRGGASDYFDLSPRLQHSRHTTKCSEDGSLRGSLLESESAFIDPNGEAFPVSLEPELRSRLLSARERRRMKRMEALSDRGSERGERQLAGLQFKVKGHQGEETENPSCGDWRTAEEHPPGSQPAPHRQVSTETSGTETWTRPGTSSALKHRADPAQSDRPSSRESLTHGWDGPSTYHG